MAEVDVMNGSVQGVGDKMPRARRVYAIFMGVVLSGVGPLGCSGSSNRVASNGGSDGTGKDGSGGPTSGGSDTDGGAESSGGTSGSGARNGLEGDSGRGGEGSGATTGTSGSTGQCVALSCEYLDECESEPVPGDCERTCTFLVGSLILKTENQLAELAGLRCSVIEANIQFFGTDITSLGGLSDLQRVDGAVTLREVALTQLDGLQNLEQAESLTIQDAENLERVELPSLAAVKSLSVYSNPNLDALVLPSLAEVERVRIIGNAALTDLDFTSLTELIELRLAGSVALSSLAGFESLTAATLLYVQGNTSLPQCEVDAFAARLGGCASCSSNDDTAVCN